MKKWFASLVLLLTVTATVYPCCAQDECASKVQSANECKNTTEGTCSPFVTCGTCCGFVQLTGTIAIFCFTPEYPVHDSQVQSLSPTSFSASLFQPPKSTT